jgi:hypothetical protein
VIVLGSAVDDLGCLLPSTVGVFVRLAVMARHFFQLLDGGGGGSNCQRNP